MCISPTASSHDDEPCAYGDCGERHRHDHEDPKLPGDFEAGIIRAKTEHVCAQYCLLSINKGILRGCRLDTYRYETRWEVDHCHKCDHLHGSIISNRIFGEIQHSVICFHCAHLILKLDAN